MKRFGCAVLLVLLLSCLASAQSADQWFVLDRFSGLNLLLEKTHLPPHVAAKAENIQFPKLGTASALEGLFVRDTITSGSFPILGLAYVRNHLTDSSRIVAACSTLFWNTYGNNWQFTKGSATVGVGGGAQSTLYQRWTDSVRVQSTDDSGRAAEMLRAGWPMRWSNNSFDTIDYISDNNTIFLTNTPNASATQYIEALPTLVSATTPVKFVPVEIGGRSMLVCLQAGMEPVLYDGNSNFGYRFFGVADSGIAKYVRYAIDTSASPDDSSRVYIVDNSKIGIFDNNEIGFGGAGYFLHTPYGFGDTDSSHWGRIWQVDSNRIVKVGDTAEFRIYFRPGNARTDQPGGVWFDSLKGSRYQLLSAPMKRDVYTRAQTPSARFVDGGIYARMATGTISAREFDHIPHFLVREFDAADTTSTTTVTTNEYCNWGCTYPGLESVRLERSCPPGYWKRICDTSEVRFTQQSIRGARYSGFPIRTSFVDTTTTPDSLVIWTSGENIASAAADVTTSDWSIVRLTIPYASDGIVYQGQLYLAGDPQEPNLVVFSEIRSGAPQIGAFPVRNQLQLAANGDIFTGFALLYDWLVIFQRDHTWLVKSPGGLPELALPDEGCIAPNSIVELDNQVLYLSNKGWRIFDGNTASDFAASVRPAVQAIPRTSYSVSQAARSKAAAAFMPTTSNIWMSMAFSPSATNNGSFLFNATDGSFSYSDEIYGSVVKTIPYTDTLFLVFGSPSAAKIYSYGYTDSLTPVGIDGDSMRVRWESGWLDFGHPQELKYVQDGAFHVTASAPVTGATRKLIVSMFKDRDTTAFYADTTNVIGIITGTYYLADNQIRLEPASEFQWLKIRIDAYGYTVSDFQRLVLRWRSGADVVRDRSTVFRPESN